MTAIGRVLRMPRRQWRLFGLATGGTECMVGAVLCGGAYPVLGGACLAALGTVFCALLAYVLVKQVPGGCGCIRWRTATETTAEAPTWRAMARSGMLFGVGIAYSVVSIGAANAPRQYWFGGGVVAGITVLVVLSMPRPVRTPVCHRPLRRKMRTTLRALASHEIFAAMTGSVGPFGPVARYGRTGCTDEFWFTVPAGQGSQAVVFQVNWAAHGARLVVHASLRDVRTSEASWPTQTITVADALPEILHGTETRDFLRSLKRHAPTAAGLTPAAPTPGADVSAADCGAPPSQASKPRIHGGRRYEVSHSP